MPKKSANKKTETKVVESFESVQSKREALERSSSLLFSTNSGGDRGQNSALAYLSLDDTSTNESQTQSRTDGNFAEQLLNFSEPIPDPIPSLSKKRKRGHEHAAEKVELWRAGQGSEPSVTAGLETLSKRVRTSGDPVKKSTAQQHAATPSDAQSFSRPNHKELRIHLREMMYHANLRPGMMDQIDDAKAMLRVADEVLKDTDVEVTEMHWTRYLIEEDVIRRMKLQPTLVDGTQKLGKRSLKGQSWKQWLARNSNHRRPDSMYWGAWKPKMRARADDVVYDDGEGDDQDEVGSVEV